MSYRKISQNLVDVRSVLSARRIALKCGGRLGSIAAIWLHGATETIVKFQNNWKTLTTDLAPSKFCEILQ